MQSSHPAHLFQSSSSLETGSRRAAKASAHSTTGNPIFLGKRQDDIDDLRLGGAGADAGKEKVLDAVVEGDGLWTAESGSIVRRIDLKVSREA